MQDGLEKETSGDVEACYTISMTWTKMEPWAKNQRNSVEIRDNIKEKSTRLEDWLDTKDIEA